MVDDRDRAERGRATNSTFSSLALRAHCAEVGRDPDEILVSTHLRLGEDGDLGALVAQAEEDAAAGLDLGIVYLPPPHTPAVLEPVADALAPLRS